MESLYGLIFIGLCVAFIWWSYRQGQAGAATVQTSRAPSDVVMAALHTFSQRGWATTAQSGQTISFSRTQAPGCLITAFLLLFGIIPGLLYWIAAKRTLTISVTAQPDRSGGSAVNVAWSRNGGGRGPSLEFLNLLAPGAPLTTASVPMPGAIRSGVEEVTDGALSGAAMRQLPTQNPSGWNPSLPAPAADPALVPAPTADPPAMPGGGLAFCPYCGMKQAVAGARFCGGCGRQLGG